MLVVGHRSWPGRAGQSSNKDHVAGMMGKNLPAELMEFGWQTVTFQIHWFSIQRMIAYIYIVYIYTFIPCTYMCVCVCSIPFGVCPKNHLKCAFLHLCTFWKPKCWPQKIETYPNISQTIPKSCSNFHDLYSVTAKFSENPEAMKPCIYVITLCRWMFVGPGMMPAVLGTPEECWHNFGPKCPAWRQGGGPKWAATDNGCFLEWGTQMDR